MLPRMESNVLISSSVASSGSNLESPPDRPTEDPRDRRDEALLDVVPD